MANNIGQISSSTRFAEGFFHGAKFSIIHAITYAPFYAKERSIENGRAFKFEYPIQCCKAFAFYTGVLSLTFGMRHFIAEARPGIISGLENNLPFMRKQPVAVDILLYMLISWPIGFTGNYLLSGRYFKGGILMTLGAALVVRALDNG